MGFSSLGKKSKAPEPVETQAKPKGSRRIVAPVSGGTASISANQAASKDGRKAPIQVSSKTSSGKLASESDAAALLPAAHSAPAPRSAPAPTSDAPTSSSQPRPKSREPIVAGQSEPPKFNGNLGSGSGRKNTPCRTGDVALLDFLENKQVALANREQKVALITHEQVEQVRAKAEQEALPIDVAAVQLGFITEEQMVNALTSACWVPHLRVDKYEIRKKALDTIAREDAIYYGVFPVDKLGSLLTLAMVNPLDEETIRVLGNKTNLDIKKVVATRSEIMQGIEKYYSGQIQVTDGSRSFSQDIEPKSVTQMMAKVVAPAPQITSGRSSRSNQLPHVPAENIVPEIQDIDDLLSSDEAIAPAIIEPISLKAEAEIVPVEDLPMPQFEPITDEPAIVGGAQRAETPRAGSQAQPPPVPTFELDMGDATPAVKPPVKAAPQEALPELAPAASAAHGADIGYDEATSAIGSNESVLTRKSVAPPKPAATPTGASAPTGKGENILAPEFEQQDSSSIAAKSGAPKPGAPKPSSAPVAPKPSQPPVSPVATAKPAVAPAKPGLGRASAAAPPIEKRPSETIAKAAPAAAAPGTGQVARPVSSRFTGTGRTKKVGVVNLIPVMEEEFQHAITHGKSHVFEKWIGLQSRNRIINAQAIDADFESRLPLLFVNSRRL